MDMPGQKKQFVRRLMVAACECGSLEYQYLNLPEDHGVYFQDVDHPLMNANDHKGDKHIMQFGRCKAETNPKNIMSKMLSKISPAFALINMAKEAMGCDGCKCSPKVINSWKNGDKANRLDGAPCITNESRLYCFYGGLIKITEMPKSADEDESAENVDAPEEKEYNPLDTVPERSLAASIISLSITRQIRKHRRRRTEATLKAWAKRMNARRARILSSAMRARLYSVFRLRRRHMLL